MASGRTLVKRYVNQAGLDLKSNDLTRQERFASAITNAQYKKSGTIEKRPGFMAHAKSGGEYGLFCYTKTDPTTGIQEAEVLSISGGLYRLKKTEITVTYTGASPTASITVFFDTTTDQYRCQVQEGTSIVLDYALGLGFDEGSTVTMNDLKGQIDGLANFTATITGLTTAPAAFSENIIDCDLTAGTCVLSAGYWEEVNTPVSTPLSGTTTNRDSTEFENPSFTQISNVAYVSNGYDYLLKYDGQNLYRAGLPSPTVPSVAMVAGSITGGPYTYRVGYVQWDASGNLIESDYSDESSQVTPAAQDVNVTLTNILAASGFNTNCAVVAGAQTTVNTITVDNGSGGNHTMKIGDTAYFYDSVSAAYVEREVTNVAASTITVAGAAVTVADNAVISNNLRIGIYRNATVIGGITDWYLVDEIPNNSFASTQVYKDSKADGSLGIQLLEPVKDRGLPPKGKYVSGFGNHLVISGNIEEPNTVFFSDDYPEYFPALNRFDVNTTEGDIVTGIAQNNEVFAIFKNRSIHVLSGSLLEDTYRVDQITQDVGCVAHATIKEFRGVLGFLSDLGPRKMIGGQVPVAMGESVDNSLVSRIDPIFEQVAVTDEEKFVLKRAIAESDRLREKYMLFIPCESVESSHNYANSNSRVYAYDYSRDSWLEWKNMNCSSGFVVYGDDLLWLERGYSTYSSAIRHILWSRHKTNTAFDYQDNNEATEFLYASAWETLGEPSVMKKFLNIRVFAIEDLKNNTTNLTIKTEHNFVADDTKSEFELEFGGGGYGETAYSDNPYGDPSEGAQKHKINSSRTRSLRVRFENSEEQENVILSGWELEVAGPFAASMKS